MNRRQFMMATGAVGGGSLAASCSSRQRVLEFPSGEPLSRFGADSTAEAVTDGVDLSGKTALVTGCNSGIGFETMRVLALRGAHVIGTGRTLQKARQACALVPGNTTPLAMELSDFDSVVACSKAVADLNLPIDMLVCNAGYVAGADQQLAYGLDLTFVINHLGHFILVNRLLQQVQAAQQGRVVMVSSFAAVSKPVVEIQFENLAFSGNYDALRSYAHSKLANALFSLDLSRRLQATRATANALHPGVIKTNIARNQMGVFRWAFGLYADLFNKSIPQGAATTAYVATNPELDRVSGRFFKDCNPVVVISPENNLNNLEMAQRLWDVSVEITQDYLS